MLTLGVSGHFGSSDADMIPGLHKYHGHDAAACLVSDGELIAAAEEERFNRTKHTNKFPGGAIRSCLKQARVQPEQIDAVCFYFANEFVDLELKTFYAIHSPGSGPVCPRDHRGQTARGVRHRSAR